MRERKMTDEEFVVRGGADCPFCGEQTLEVVGVHNFGETLATNKLTCWTCGKVWLDKYILVGYEEVSPE